MNNDELSYSEIMNMASELKIVSGQIDELVSIIRNDDYNRIGENGDVLIGDTAQLAKNTFNDLATHVPEFVSLINEYADTLVSSLN